MVGETPCRRVNSIGGSGEYQVLQPYASQLTRRCPLVEEWLELLDTIQSPALYNLALLISYVLYGVILLMVVMFILQVTQRVLA